MLQDELHDGPRPVNQLKRAAEEAGISWPTVERAKKQLKVRARKGPDHWTWELPEPDEIKAISPIRPSDGLDGLEGAKAIKTIKTAATTNGDGLPDPFEPNGSATCDDCGSPLAAFAGRLACFNAACPSTTNSTSEAA